MNANDLVFYALSAFVLGTGILAVTTRQIFRAAIFLLFSLMGVAGIYFWMQMEFLAAVQIVVYVGGIVVLIIFSIFLTQKSGVEMPAPVSRRTLFSLLAVLAGAAYTCLLIYRNGFTANDAAGQLQVSVSDVGTQMLNVNDTGYALPFEVISILLLAAMIGCIVIALKTPRQETISTQ